MLPVIAFTASIPSVKILTPNFPLAVKEKKKKRLSWDPEKDSFRIKT